MNSRGSVTHGELNGLLATISFIFIINILFTCVWLSSNNDDDDGLIQVMSFYMIMLKLAKWMIYHDCFVLILLYHCSVMSVM